MDVGRLVSVRAATDVRFNRRDSLILQWSSVAWADNATDTTVDFGAVGNAFLQPYVDDAEKLLSAQGAIPLSTYYTASVAWQVAWKNAHLRMGVGLPIQRVTWLTQTMEFSMRFGGKSNIERTKQWQTWRKNKKEIDRGFPTQTQMAGGNGTDRDPEA